MVIYMGDREGDVMKDGSGSWTRQAREAFCWAEEGRIEFDPSSNDLVLKVFNASAELRDEENLDAMSRTYGRLRLAIQSSSSRWKRSGERRSKRLRRNT